MNADKEQAKQILQAAQAQQGQQGQPGQQQIPPNMVRLAQEAMAKPSWEEIIALLREDNPRQFRIDVETEASAESDVQKDKQDVVELLTAIGQLWQAGANGMQSGMIDKEKVDALTLAMVRKFNLGRQVEDILDPDSNKKIVEGNPEAEALKQQLQQASQMIQDLQKQLKDKQSDLALKKKMADDKIAANDKLNQDRLKVQEKKNVMDFTIDQEKIELDEDALQLEADIAGVEAQFRAKESEGEENNTSEAEADTDKM
jgi:uncharacterized membrane protein YhiD involved in acid resistance